MLKGFKEFILRGNVVDLAVGVIIGVAFTAIVSALVANIFNPLIGVLFNATNLTKAFNVDIPALPNGKPGVLAFGAVLAAIIQFLIIAFVVYFAIVLPINHLAKLTFAKQKKGGGHAERPSADRDRAAHPDSRPARWPIVARG